MLALDSPSLRLQRVLYDETNAEYHEQRYNVHAYVGGMAHVFWEDDVLPHANASTPVLVYLTMGDHLGSSAITIDKASSELVERTTYLPQGGVESDYRPDRWSAFREDYKFTGKEEDIEVGAVYFGARYYQPQLGRFMSPDPLSIHTLAGDLNPYAYVGGRMMSFVDPWGLDSEPPPGSRNPTPCGDGASTCWDRPGYEVEITGGPTDQDAPPADNAASTATTAAENAAARVGAGAEAALARTEAFADRALAAGTQGLVTFEDTTHYFAFNQAFSVGFVSAFPIWGGIPGGPSFADAFRAVGINGDDNKNAETVGFVAAMATVGIITGGAAGVAALGRGSTANLAKGTTLARNLREELAIKEVMSNPAAGEKLTRLKMTDARWPSSDGWVKMQQLVRSGGREGPINVHYLWNEVTGAVDDLKIVLPGGR